MGGYRHAVASTGKDGAGPGEAQARRVAVRARDQPLAWPAARPRAGTAAASTRSTSTTCAWSGRSRRTRWRPTAATSRASRAYAQTAQAPLLELRQADLTDFIGSLREEGLSARSVARAVHALRGLFRFAVREGRLDADPMENLQAPRAPSTPCPGT